MEGIWNLIWKGIEPELLAFFGELNWTYIIMYVIILYGITYKQEFDWFNKLINKHNLSKYTSWIAGLATGLIFCLFKWLEDSPSISWNYISVLMRSWFLVVVFASLFIDGVVKLIKFLGKKIDDKEK